jgi:ribonuclease G
MVSLEGHAVRGGGGRGPEEDARGTAAEAVVAPAAGTRREILVSFVDDEPRIAVIEGGHVVEVDIDRPGGRRIVGNVYKGRVQNVLPGMQAAFVDIGLERNAFLFVDDARPLPSEDGDQELPPAVAPVRPGSAQDIAALLRPGDEILVQVRKEPSGTKGARVTRAVNLPGRFLVFMPGVDGVGVSHRIADPAERERLRSLVHRHRSPGHGYIVRTAAAGVTAADLLGDMALLASLWQQLRARARHTAGPGLVYRDLDVVQRLLRDRLNEEVERVVVDDRHEWERMRAMAAIMAPGLAGRIELANPEELRIGLFACRGVDAALDRALARRVALPSGGSIVIDQAEALTAIDVNTGRFVGAASPDETFLRTNLEAAAEIARQIRLRDIGGIIIIDFIDMEPPEHRRQVRDALEAACAPDRSRPQVLGITQLGLVEMTRKKARQNLQDLLTRPCSTCDGRGRVPTEETLRRRVRERLRALLAAAEAEAVLVEMHPSAAALVIGPNGAGLRALERASGRGLFVRGVADCRLDEIRLRSAGRRDDLAREAVPVHEGDVLDVRVERPHVSFRGDGIARVDGYVLDVVGGAPFTGQQVRVRVMQAFRTYARAEIIDGADRLDPATADGLTAPMSPRAESP